MLRRVLVRTATYSTMLELRGLGQDTGSRPMPL
jgi:hypothetical protein